MSFVARDANRTELRGTTVLTDGTLSQPRTDEDRSAAEMLPDDLWQILTGQQPPRASLPEPAEPAYGEADDVEVYRPSWDELPDEEALYEQRRAEEERERLERRRQLLARRTAGELEHSAERAPVIVSMEPTSISSVRRHADHHARSLPAAPKVQRGTSALPHPLLLGSPDELRRAVLLQEILGKPKGLED